MKKFTICKYIKISSFESRVEDKDEEKQITLHKIYLTLHKICPKKGSKNRKRDEPCIKYDSLTFENIHKIFTLL
jgi:hypothetical protein